MDDGVPAAGHTKNLGAAKLAEIIETAEDQHTSVAKGNRGVLRPGDLQSADLSIRLVAHFEDRKITHSKVISTAGDEHGTVLQQSDGGRDGRGPCGRRQMKRGASRIENFREAVHRRVVDDVPLVRRVQKLSRHARLETLQRYDDNRADHQGDVTGVLSALLGG